MTGIPPYIKLYESQQQTKEAVDQIPTIVISGMAKVLDERSISCGTITRATLTSTLRELLIEAGMIRPDGDGEDTPPAQPNPMYYMWKGKFHMFPENFDLPSLDLLGAWRLWWFGNQERHYPPYRFISTKDLSTKLKREGLTPTGKA